MTEVHAEIEEVSRLRSNLDPLEENYRTRKLELSTLEQSLQTKSAELLDVQQQIQKSTKHLKYLARNFKQQSSLFFLRFSDIKTSLALAPSESLETRLPSVSPYLVPALGVSLLLNLVTGGAIITNYLEPTARSDEETRDPYQARAG